MDSQSQYANWVDKYDVLLAVYWLFNDDYKNCHPIFRDKKHAF